MNAARALAALLATLALPAPAAPEEFVVDPGHTVAHTDQARCAAAS